MGIPDHLTCLLRNLYAGEEATESSRHGTTDWFQIGKGERQGYMLSPCLFNLYTEYILWNAMLDEAQAENKIARRNINNLRYADDTTLVGERKEELKNLLQVLRVSAPGWCTGKTQMDRVEREVGGVIGMGNICKSMADSCQCMAKTTTIL